MSHRIICGGLSENGSCRLICWNTWSLFGTDQVMWLCWKGYITGNVGFDILKKTCVIPSVLSASCLWITIVQLFLLPCLRSTILDFNSLKPCVELNHFFYKKKKKKKGELHWRKWVTGGLLQILRLYRAVPLLVYTLHPECKWPGSILQPLFPDGCSVFFTMTTVSLSGKSE